MYTSLPTSNIVHSKSPDIAEVVATDSGMSQLPPLRNDSNKHTPNAMTNKALDKMICSAHWVWNLKRKEIKIMIRQHATLIDVVAMPMVW